MSFYHNYHMKSTIYQWIIKTTGFILILFWVILAASCGSKYSSEISRVDSMLVVQSDLLSKIQAVDLAKYDEIRKHATEGMEELKKIQPDEQSKTDYLEYITAYGDIQKAIKRGTAAARSLQMSLQESKTQLENLKHDLRHNLIADSLVAKYLQSEAEVLNQLTAKGEKALLNMQTKEEIYKQIANQADSFIKAHKQ